MEATRIDSDLLRTLQSSDEVGHPLLLPEPVRFPCETHQTHDSN